MSIVLSVLAVTIGLMVLLGHDPLRLVLRLVVAARAAGFYAEAALTVLRREHSEMARWAWARAKEPGHPVEVRR